MNTFGEALKGRWWTHRSSLDWPDRRHGQWDECRARLRSSTARARKTGDRGYIVAGRVRAKRSSRRWASRSRSKTARAITQIGTLLNEGGKDGVQQHSRHLQGGFRESSNGGNNLANSRHMLKGLPLWASCHDAQCGRFRIYRDDADQPLDSWSGQEGDSIATSLPDQILFFDTPYCLPALNFQSLHRK